MGKTVRDIMKKDVVSVAPDTSVRRLMKLLLDNSVSGVPVCEGGRPIGVVSMTDVLQLGAHEAEVPAGQLAWGPTLLAEERDEGASDGSAGKAGAFTASVEEAGREASFDQYTVRDIMTPVTFSLRPTDELETASSFLLRGHIHRALVVEDGQ
ncbi:MAG TPA: CBS domain-containing protein, partial [Longimicrobiales bacterium]|nr:CBS domain-containing protein [Longimicrobiales bacterium]